MDIIETNRLTKKNYIGNFLGDKLFVYWLTIHTKVFFYSSSIIKIGILFMKILVYVILVVLFNMDDIERYSCIQILVTCATFF